MDERIGCFMCRPYSGSGLVFIPSHTIPYTIHHTSQLLQFMCFESRDRRRQTHCIPTCNNLDLQALRSNVYPANSLPREGSPLPIQATENEGVVILAR